MHIKNCYFHIHFFTSSTTGKVTYILIYKFVNIIRIVTYIFFVHQFKIYLALSKRELKKKNLEHYIKYCVYEFRYLKCAFSILVNVRTHYKSRIFFSPKAMFYFGIVFFIHIYLTTEKK